MIFLFGVVLVFVSGYLSYYLLSLENVKALMENFPFPYEFVVTTIVFFLSFIVYYFVAKSNRKVDKEIIKLNDNIKQFLNNGVKGDEELSFKTTLLQRTVILLNELQEQYMELKTISDKKIRNYKEVADSLIDIFDLESVLVLKVNQDGKVIKANKRVLKFLAFESEVKLNMSVKNIRDIFDTAMPERWLNDLLNNDMEVVIKKVKFRLHIEKVERLPEYVLTLIDVTEFEKQKERLEFERNFINKNLKTENALNKSFEITMIQILNYDHYAEHLGLGILDLFEEKFSLQIKSLGYDEVFKIQNNLFAVYDLKPNFESHKKILEESLIIEVGDDKYIFNPQVILGSGVNFEQAKQQVIESSKTFIQKQKSDIKYSPEIIKLVNENVLNEKVALGYTIVENQRNTIIIEPVIKDEYSGTLVKKDIVLSLAEDFNIYLQMIKILFLNNINFLKDKKLIVNVKSNILLSQTALHDLLLLIRREDLRVVFNVEINSNYAIVFPILKMIKSYAQLGLRKVGKGYISFRDIYALKVEYLEVDDTIIALINSNPQWKFLLDAVKIILKGQNSKIISRNYKDEKVFKIGDEFKVYEG